jgi:hypothetical protein
MQDDPLLEQLDWFFTSPHWTSQYPATTVMIQGKPTSDHTPCTISIETRIPGSKIFRFESFWVAHPGFQQIVADSWNKPVYKKSSAATLNAKFKRLRYDLKHWSKSISKLSICIENCNQAIAEIDKIEELRTLSTAEMNFRKILKIHLARLLSYQNEYWKKRCTIRCDQRRLSLGMRIPNFSRQLLLRGTEEIMWLHYYCLMETLSQNTRTKKKLFSKHIKTDLVLALHLKWNLICHL